MQTDFIGIARAVDVQTLEIYHGASRPGWACWPAVWQDADGAVYVAFQELRRASNPRWQPVPADFWEAMMLPASYQITLCGGTPDIVPESVVMKSSDGCQTWVEIGRDDARVTSSFAWHSLPDGRIMRIVSNDYLAWGENVSPTTYSEISADGGLTWTNRAVLLEDYVTDVSAYRLRVLSDGTLAALGCYAAAWQPGRERLQRPSTRPYVRQETTSAFWFSTDGSHTWTGPCCVLPGVVAYEADFCELPSGDLLIANSAVQHGPQVRQYLRKTRHGWIPGPVCDVAAGQVPERLAYGRDGLIVGAVRCGAYVCSNDDGATWHQIADVPHAEYQPFTLALHDGRFLTVWHAGGGDEPFGTTDLWIGAHLFRLAGSLPHPTKLTIARQLDATGGRYGNIYQVVLTCGGQPVTEHTIRYRYTRRDGDGGEGAVTTDAGGQACIDLTGEFARETNMHVSYSLNAWFDPEEDEATLAPCRSETVSAYAITATRQELGW